MMPPVTKRLQVRIRCVYLTCLLLLALWLDQVCWAYRSLPIGWRPSWIKPDLLVFAGLSPIAVFLSIKARNLKKSVKAANYRLCTHCLYNLEGHESLGICPECGTPFTARKLEADWREFTDPDWRFWRWRFWRFS